MIRLIAVLSFVVALGRVAGAAPEYAFVVDLDVETGQQPAYLCVITARGSLTAKGEKLSLPLSALESGVLEPALRDLDGRRFATSIPPALAHELELEKRDRIQQAVELLTRRTQPRSCSAGYDDCAPRLWSSSTRAWFSRFPGGTQREDLHITCAENSATPRSERAENHGVAIISLDFIQGQDMPIAEPRLDGSAVSIVVRGAIPRDEVAAVRVVGGDYLVGSSHFTAGGRAVLPLQPLCSVHTVRLPAVNLLASEELAVLLLRTGEAKPVRECAPTVSGNQLEMMLPNSVRRDEYTLNASVRNVSLTTTWSATSPPAELMLHANSVAFKWSPDCTYPLSAVGCPRAELDGVPCDGHLDGLDCAYACSTKGTFELPSVIVFSNPQDLQRWTAALRFPGQVISQYIEPANRKVSMTLDGWDDIPLKERLNILGIELEFPSGKRQILDLRDKLLQERRYTPIELNVPELSCSAKLKYRVVNDRLAEFTELLPRDGKLVAPVPKCGISAIPCITFLVGAGIGVLNRSRSNDLPGPTLQNALTVSGYAHGEYLPWDAWYFVEFGYAATIGAREYLAVGPTSTVSAAALYGRLGYDLILGLRTPNLPPLLPRLQLGLGVTGGWGHVLSPGDGTEIGGDWYLSPSLQLRWGQISLIARLMLFEELVEVSTATGQRLRDHSITPLGYELRYTF